MALTDNLLAYWKLDETSGNPVDSSGNGKTLTNNNSVGFVAGLLNNEADFGVANTNKSLTRTGLIGTDGAYSISLWVKIQTEITTGTYNLFTESTESTSLSIAYEYNAGARRLRVTRGRNNLAYVYVDRTITLGTSSRYHLIVTYSGSQLTLSINNVDETPVAASGNGTVAWSPGGGAVTIGASHDANTPSSLSQYSSVLIDEVGLWQKELTSAEKTQLYGEGVSLAYSWLIGTTSASSISGSSAISGGNIYSDGGSTITERGVCYSTTTTPTTADSKVSTTGTTGAYSVTLTGLTINTLYYTRAYYINGLGTTYGNPQKTFTTLNINQYELQKDIGAVDGQTFIGQINVTGTIGTVTVKLGTSGTSTVINAGAGVSSFSGTYSGLSGLIITRSATFNGTIDNVYWIQTALSSVVDFTLDAFTIISTIDSSVFFKRIEDDVFNSFRFYRYLDILFKDLDGYVTVTVRDEREDNSVDRTKTFSVGNPSTSTVSPFQKKRISFLVKNQAIIIGVSNANIGETFSIAKFILTGHKKTARMFAPNKIQSLS